MGVFKVYYFLLMSFSGECSFDKFVFKLLLFFQILRALEGGSAVLKDLTGKTTADEVANVMDNLADVSLNPIPAIHSRCCMGGRVVGFLLQLSER